MEKGAIKNALLLTLALMWCVLKWVARRSQQMASWEGRTVWVIRGCLQMRKQAQRG